jgi:hypothetical protein
MKKNIVELIEHETYILSVMLKSDFSRYFILKQVKKLKELLKLYNEDREYVFGDILKDNIITDEKTVNFFKF